MPCCSDARAQASRPALRAIIPEPARVVPVAADIALCYTGAASLALRGPASGRVYRIDPRHADVAAAAMDVDTLLRTGLFVRV